MHFALYTSTALFALACGSGVEPAPVLPHEDMAHAEPARQYQSPDTTLAAELSRTFRGAAARALPVIVHVAVEREAPPDAPELEIPEYFRRFIEPPDEPVEMPPAESTGTGFVYDPSGLVLTSGHVVEGASVVRVRLQDGRQLEAEIEGSIRRRM